MFKYFFSALFAAALWGFMSIPLKAIESWQAEEILFYRIVVATVIIWPIILIFRKKQLVQDWKSVVQLPSSERNYLFLNIFIATILIIGNWFTFIYAVNHISVSSAAFAYMVCPLLTTLAGVFLLKESLSRLKFMALCIAGLSVFLLARGSFIEVLWSVSIGALYAFYLIIQRIVRIIDKLNMLAVQLSLACILVIPYFLWTGISLPSEPIFWTNVSIIAVLFTIIPLYLSMYSLIGLPSSTAGIMIYINPIITFLVAIFYFDEPVSPEKLQAYGILLIAVFLFNAEFFIKKRELVPQSY